MLSDGYEMFVSTCSCHSLYLGLDVEIWNMTVLYFPLSANVIYS